MLHPNCTRTGLLRRRPGKLARPGRSADPLHAVLRDRQITRVRTRRQTARAANPGTAERHRGSSRTATSTTCGARPSTTSRARRATASCGPPTPRTCPRNTTASPCRPNLTDPDGLPAPKIEYRISDNTRKTAEIHGRADGRGPRGRRRRPRHHSRALDRSARVICSAPPAWVDDPATSVVDSYGKDPRRRQPLHRRRQHLRHVWFGEPHLHDQRPGAAGGQESRRTGLGPKGTVMTTSSDRRLSVPPRHTTPPRPLTDR